MLIGYSRSSRERESFIKSLRFKVLSEIPKSKICVANLFWVVFPHYRNEAVLSRDQFSLVQRVLLIREAQFPEIFVHAYSCISDNWAE
jgi:hypothetical protein